MISQTKLLHTKVLHAMYANSALGMQLPRQTWHLPENVIELGVNAELTLTMLTRYGISASKARLIQELVS